MYDGARSILQYRIVRHHCAVLFIFIVCTKTTNEERNNDSLATRSYVHICMLQCNRNTTKSHSLWFSSNFTANTSIAECRRIDGVNIICPSDRNRANINNNKKKTFFSSSNKLLSNARNILNFGLLLNSSLVISFLLPVFAYCFVISDWKKASWLHFLSSNLLPLLLLFSVQVWQPSAAIRKRGIV